MAPPSMGAVAGRPQATAGGGCACPGPVWARAKACPQLAKQPVSVPHFDMFHFGLVVCCLHGPRPTGPGNGPGNISSALVANTFFARSQCSLEFNIFDHSGQGQHAHCNVELVTNSYLTIVNWTSVNNFLTEFQRLMVITVCQLGTKKWVN